MAEPRSAYTLDRNGFLHLPSSDPVLLFGRGPGRQVTSGPVVGPYTVECHPGSFARLPPTRVTGKGCSPVCRGLSSSTWALFTLPTRGADRAVGADAEFRWQLSCRVPVV